MTEFALVLPVFLLIVAGLLAFGRVFFYWISANHAANETARWAAVDRNPFAPTTLKAHVRNSVTAEFSDNAVVCITLPEGSAVGRPVTVTVEAPFTFVPLLDIGTLTIRGSATMRIERLAGPDGISPAAYTPDPISGACAP